MAHNKTHLIGTFYRPLSSSIAFLSSIEDSIGLALDTNIESILVTGDFNLDLSKRTSKRQISDLYQQFNLGSLINESAHFTETCSTIIGLFSTSCKYIPFLNQNICYHCPIYCVFNSNNLKKCT